MFKRVSIVFIPAGAGTVRQFRIWRFLPVLLVIFALSWFICLSIFIGDYRSTKKKVTRLARLELESKGGRGEFLNLAERIRRTMERVGELKDQDRKIRMAAHVKPGEENSKYKGVGGSNPDLILCSYPTPKSNRNLVASLYRSLDNLDKEIGIGKRNKALIHDFIENREAILTTVCSEWPIDGEFTSAFGYRKSPFSGRSEFHEGVDIATRMGTPILAPAEGTVESVGWKYGYGRQLTIDHGFGLLTRYAHLKKALVEAGQRIEKGQRIALVGNTGRSTGPHLHYEVHLNGVPVDPLR